jgi:hypothetical protein
MHTDQDQPYISLVITARNDNHGEDMVRRMQAFFDSWIAQARRYGLDSEIVVVEWNPPAGRGKLKDEFRWPESASPCAVRFLEVSPERHAAIPNAALIPLHQMIAKNAGIRRARGRFVLCTNLDIIFSAELMQFLAARTLDSGAMYRMDRYDVAKEIPSGGNVDELLAFCKAHIRRVSAREGTFDTCGDNLRPVEARDILLPDSGLLLGHGWFAVENDEPTMRYVGPVGVVAFDRRSAGERQILLDVDVGPCARDGWVELDLLDEHGSQLDSILVDGRCRLRLTIPEAVQSGRFGLRARHGGVALLQDVRMLDLRVFAIEWMNGGAASEWKLSLIDWSPGVDRGSDLKFRSPYAAGMRNPVYLHTNACGDFTILAREAWFALRGYPEFPVWPTHIDALLCYAAYHAGMPEILLGDPLRIFHIQHQAVWTPEQEQEREKRAAARGVALVGYQSLMEYLHHMRRFSAPLIFTSEDWGLAGLDLPESTP